MLEEFVSEGEWGDLSIIKYVLAALKFEDEVLNSKAEKVDASFISESCRVSETVAGMVSYRGMGP